MARGREGNGVTNVDTRSNKPTAVALRSSTFLSFGNTPMMMYIIVLMIAATKKYMLFD